MFQKAIEGAGEQPAHALAQRDRLDVLPELDVGRILDRAQLHGLGDRLLLAGIGLARERVAQLLHLGVARPAERRLVAARR